jgi:hypothetical protein
LDCPAITVGEWHPTIQGQKRRGRPRTDPSGKCLESDRTARSQGPQANEAIGTQINHLTTSATISAASTSFHQGCASDAEEWARRKAQAVNAQARSDARTMWRAEPPPDADAASSCCSSRWIARVLWLDGKAPASCFGRRARPAIVPPPSPRANSTTPCRNLSTSPRPLLPLSMMQSGVRPLRWGPVLAMQPSRIMPSCG